METQFSETFFALLIYGSLILSGLGALGLIILLWVDQKQKNIW